MGDSLWRFAPRVSVFCGCRGPLSLPRRRIPLSPSPPARAVALDPSVLRRPPSLLGVFYRSSERRRRGCRLSPPVRPLRQDPGPMIHQSPPPGPPHSTHPLTLYSGGRCPHEMIRTPSCPFPRGSFCDTRPLTAATRADLSSPRPLSPYPGRFGSPALGWFPPRSHLVATAPSARRRVALLAPPFSH